MVLATATGIRDISLYNVSAYATTNFHSGASFINIGLVE